MKKIDIIGKEFGRLTVVSQHSKTRNGHIRYQCKCSCGKISNVLGTHLRQGNSKSCGCAIPVGRAHKDWNGVGKISGAFWYDHIVKSANGSKGRSPVDLTLTKQQAWDLFIKQDGKCALSGIILSFPERHNDKTWTASLDRIDSSKGYTQNNVQWLHKDVNMMKRIYDQDYFINICKLIANENKQI